MGKVYQLIFRQKGIDVDWITIRSPKSGWSICPVMLTKVQWFYSLTLSILSYIYIRSQLAGWQYALKFHGAVWHGTYVRLEFSFKGNHSLMTFFYPGNYKHFRSFVRRRRWIRLRRRLVPVKSEEQEETNVSEAKLIDVDDNDSGFPQSSSSTASSLQALDNPQHLKDELAKCRLDRERLRVLGQVVSMGGGTSEQLMRQVCMMMGRKGIRDISSHAVQPLGTRDPWHASIRILQTAIPRGLWMTWIHLPGCSLIYHHSNYSRHVPSWEWKRNVHYNHCVFTLIPKPSWTPFNSLGLYNHSPSAQSIYCIYNSPYIHLLPFLHAWLPKTRSHKIKYTFDTRRVYNWFIERKVLNRRNQGSCHQRACDEPPRDP